MRDAGAPHAFVVNSHPWAPEGRARRWHRNAHLLVSLGKHARNAARTRARPQRSWIRAWLTTKGFVLNRALGAPSRVLDDQTRATARAKLLPLQTFSGWRRLHAARSGASSVSARSLSAARGPAARCVGGEVGPLPRALPRLRRLCGPLRTLMRDLAHGCPKCHACGRRRTREGGVSLCRVAFLGTCRAWECPIGVGLASPCMPGVAKGSTTELSPPCYAQRMLSVLCIFVGACHCETTFV